jgi:hypothetical protein
MEKRYGYKNILKTLGLLFSLSCTMQSKSIDPITFGVAGVELAVGCYMAYNSASKGLGELAETNLGSFVKNYICNPENHPKSYRVICASLSGVGSVIATEIGCILALRMVRGPRAIGHQNTGDDSEEEVLKKYHRDRLDANLIELAEEKKRLDNIGAGIAKLGAQNEKDLAEIADRNAEIEKRNEERRESKREDQKGYLRRAGMSISDKVTVEQVLNYGSDYLRFIENPEEKKQAEDGVERLKKCSLNSDFDTCVSQSTQKGNWESLLHDKWVAKRLEDLKYFCLSDLALEKLGPQNKN